MLERASPGETLAYSWDTAGRMIGIVRNGSNQATFTYDGDGNRRSKTSGGQTTTYVNDGRGLAQVLQATTGSTTVSYAAGAQHDSSKPTENERWGYTLSDAQNSRLLVDNAGNQSHRWEWEPFGRARADSGTTAAAFSFSGEERDDETGLINLRARYYDPGIGRFLSRDSIPGVMTVPQSWNRFSYVENDPINATDPTGHKKKTKIKWPMGMDPDDDSHAQKKLKACKNPGQYTGSCKGGPPNAAYAAHGEADDYAKKSGQASASGNLAAAAAYLQSAQHFASIAGTSAAWTATLQAYASLLTAAQSIQGAHAGDNSTTPRATRPYDPRIACAGGPACTGIAFSVGPLGPYGACQCDGVIPQGNTIGELDDADDGNDCTTEGLAGFIIQIACTIMRTQGEGNWRIETWQGPVVVSGAVAMASSPAGSGSSGSGSDPQGNKTHGDAFRDEIAEAFRARGYTVDTEVTKHTPFGDRRVDIEVRKDGVLLGGIETKAGKSRYRSSQRATAGCVRVDSFVNLWG